MAKHIAIVEDETAIRENYSAAFARQGYKVSGYSDRKQSLEAFSVRLPDLVIIDVSLGDEAEGGFDLCRELRTRSPELPIIFLTAMDSELDVISGLRLGADDYLTKDISINQILARVSALFRRVEALSQPVSQGQKLVKGKLELDIDRLSAHWDGEKIPLSLTEFWLVHALARFPGHVKNRQQLMDAANTVLDDHTITTHIKRIRHKFCELAPDFNAIETVYGMGYRWIEE